MADQTETTQTPPAAAPAAQAAPAAPATSPATQAAPTAPTDPAGNNPAWLKDRLAQAEKTTQAKILADLGTSDLSDVKKRLQELDTLKTSQLSERERLEKQIAELTPQAGKAAQLETMVTKMVDVQFGALPEQTQTAVDAVANGDPAKRWELMQVLSAAGSPVAPAATQQAFTPATTAPVAPAPPTSTQPQTIAEKHAALQKVNPVQAAIFGRVNGLAIASSKE